MGNKIIRDVLRKRNREREMRYELSSVRDTNGGKRLWKRIGRCL